MIVRARLRNAMCTLREMPCCRGGGGYLDPTMLSDVAEKDLEGLAFPSITCSGCCITLTITCVSTKSMHSSSSATAALGCLVYIPDGRPEQGVSSYQPAENQLPKTVSSSAPCVVHVCIQKVLIYRPSGHSCLPRHHPAGGGLARRGEQFGASSRHPPTNEHPMPTDSTCCSVLSEPSPTPSPALKQPRHWSEPPTR